MAAKLVTHALSTPNRLPETSSEALILLSVAPADVALKFLQGDGKKWTTDIEGKRIYIDLLHNAEKFSDLRDFCEDEIEQGADDWKVVKGWIDGHIGVFRSDTSQWYLVPITELILVRELRGLCQSLITSTLFGISPLERYISRQNVSQIRK